MANLINLETGEIDQLALFPAIRAQAIREYGSANFPPRVQRSATQWVMARAEAERRQWHRDLNLPVPGEENLVPITPYGRPKYGLRFSEF